MTTQKMKVEIWSDIMCPFCYIGKRHCESALQQFANAGNIEVEWHSFQLDPGIKHEPDKSLYQYLAERKGFSYEESVKMHDHVTGMAKNAGLDYHFDKAVIANSFDAHRLIQFAKTQQLGDAAEEALFKAYFTDGKDMSDRATLIELATTIGLDPAQATQVIDDPEAFAPEVDRDIQEAQQIGVRGVPFFVFDRKYAVSGAQPSATFLEVIEKSFAEWRQANPNALLQMNDGPVCTPDGCD